MPESVERKLSMQANERRRSMGNEDSEWLEAEQENLAVIDPARAATEAVGGTVGTGPEDADPSKLSAKAER